MERDTDSAQNDDGGTASNYYEIYKSAGTMTGQISLLNSDLDKIMSNQQKYQDTSIVGDWHFDEGSGLTANDSSAYGNNGTLCHNTTCPQQGPTWQTSGCISNDCLSFDGNGNYAKIGINPAAGYTVEGWVYLNATTDMDIWGDEYSWRGEGLQLVSGSFNTICSTGGTAHRWSIGFGPSANTWYHVVQVYDTMNTKTYINGVLQNTMSYVLAQQTGLAFKFGRSSNGSYFTTYFNGLIDEPRIYKRSLQACEVCSLCRQYQSKTFCNNCTNCSGN